MPDKYGGMSNREARLVRRRMRKFGGRGKETPRLDRKIKDLADKRLNKKTDER